MGRSHPPGLDSLVLLVGLMVRAAAMPFHCGDIVYPRSTWNTLGWHSNPFQSAVQWHLSSSMALPLPCHSIPFNSVLPKQLDTPYSEKL